MPHFTHSRLRLIASLLSEGLESTTFDSVQPHLGQRKIPPLQFYSRKINTIPTIKTAQEEIDSFREILVVKKINLVLIVRQHDFRAGRQSVDTDIVIVFNPVCNLLG